MQKEKTLLPLVADNEKAICNAIDKVLPGVYHLRCWNHMINAVKVWLHNHGATSSEVPVYIASIRELFYQASESDYLSKLEELKVDWSSTFLEYYKHKIHPEVCISA